MIGKNYLWGSMLSSDEHSIVLTPNPGINGPVGPGWYVHFYDGAPMTVEIRLDLVPMNRSIMVALKYPTDTTFTMQIKDWRDGSPLFPLSFFLSSPLSLRFFSYHNTIYRSLSISSRCGEL